MLVLLDGLHSFRDHRGHLVNQLGPFCALRQVREVFVHHIVVANRHQVLEHALLDSCDVLSLSDALSIDALKLSLVQVEEHVSNEANQDVTKSETILFEDKGLVQISNLRIEEACDLVRLEEQFTGHHFDKEKVGQKQHLISIVLQLPLSTVIEIN